MCQKYMATAIFCKKRTHRTNGEVAPTHSAPARPVLTEKSVVGQENHARSTRPCRMGGINGEKIANLCKNLLQNANCCAIMNSDLSVNLQKNGECHTSEVSGNRESSKS